MKKPECPFIDTSWKKRYPNLNGLDGKLAQLIRQVLPMLPTLPKESDCPEFGPIFELGFYAGLMFFWGKELKRHQKDIEQIAQDIQNLEGFSGLKMRLTQIPADFWFESPK